MDQAGAGDEVGKVRDRIIIEYLFYYVKGKSDELTMVCKVNIAVGFTEIN
jgi:hypothetical protein